MIKLLKVIIKSFISFSSFPIGRIWVFFIGILFWNRSILWHWFVVFWEIFRLVLDIFWLIRLETGLGRFHSVSNVDWSKLPILCNMIRPRPPQRLKIHSRIRSNPSLLITDFLIHLLTPTNLLQPVRSITPLWIRIPITFFVLLFSVRVNFLLGWNRWESFYKVSGFFLNCVEFFFYFAKCFFIHTLGAEVGGSSCCEDICMEMDPGL